MRAIGRKTNRMGMERRFGLTVRCTRDNTYEEKSKEKGCLHGQMGQRIRETLWMATSKDQEYIFGMTKEATQENGKVTKWMASVHFVGQMEDCTLVNTTVIRKRVMEFSLGQTEDRMKDCGKVENSMV